MWPEISPRSQLRGWLWAVGITLVLAALLRHLGKTMADDEPVSLLTILISNGIDDAIWSLRAIDDCPEKRLYAVRIIRQSAQHLLTDARSLDALDVVELHAVGEAAALAARVARAAAWNAVQDARAARNAVLAAEAAEAAMRGILWTFFVHELAGANSWPAINQ